MTRKNLVDFFKTTENSKNKVREPPRSMIGKPSKNREGFRVQPEAPNELPPSYLLSAGYDGTRGTAFIKLYEPKSEKIYFWYDKTGHKPYCLTNLPANELERIGRLKLHPGFDHFETIDKYDPLIDRQITITKIVAKDPLAIGGRPSGCIRDIIPDEYPKIIDPNKPVKVWEAAIKYYQSYIYDQYLAPGMIYKIDNGQLVACKHKQSEATVKRILKLFQDEPKEFLENVEMWARLLEYPAPRFRRVAIDIEVASPKPTRVPDPREAAHPIISAALFGSDNKKKILLLKRNDIVKGAMELPSGVKTQYFDSEAELILEVFKTLWDYPFVITFNGDDFDLRYLYHRALNHLDLKRNQIPIEVRRRVCLLKRGIHIDLYRFFFNRSIQVYAFSQKYRDVSLDAVGRALVGLAKITLDKSLSELSYAQLARYNFKDAEITYALTAFDDDLVMKLILAITRIARMPMEDVSRQGVSRWIRNFLHHEHRRKGMLIPNADDIIGLKGLTTTKATIKGKKYKGAIVVEPVPGVHFDVAVMDFASLYPSIIKVYNLGYQSVLCSHEKCKNNKVPETPHWICQERSAIESLLIGALRDLRVHWYKPKSKDESLPSELRSWYRVIQSALKVILNASYGVFGAEAFDLYCPPVAEATAAIGRHVITKTIDKAQELGIEVIYGDTDSLFLRGPSPDQIKMLEEWAENELGMELDVDKFYRYSVFSSRKKNYLGVLSDGNVDVKGMTGKKRHIPAFIKEAFDQMEERLGQVKSPADFEKAKDEIKRIIRDRYLRLKQRRWGEKPQELAFHVVLGKVPEAYTKTMPQHVRAALVLKDMGYEIKAGDLISFVKVSKKPHVKPVQLASNNEIDVAKYVAYLHSTFDQVLDAMGLDFDEIIGLTKLERFM